jgi:excinuclease ABC subunit C
MQHKGSIAESVNKIPNQPGIYQFFDAEGALLYIGKAKNLHKRVSSYFQISKHDSYKLSVMVKKIAEIRFILVNHESDALLLENSLIKEYKPRYNILLKDDKTFPWICIVHEPFPRVIQTRNYILDGSEYFGPYTSTVVVRMLLSLFRDLFSLRTCRLKLNENDIKWGKFKRCLEFQLGNCSAPCEGLITSDDYETAILEIRKILQGHTRDVLQHLKEKMRLLADQLMFEQASMVKEKIGILEKFYKKSTVVNTRIAHVDVFSIVDEKDQAFINFMKVVNSTITQVHNVVIQKRIEEKPEDILGYSIFDLRQRFKSNAKRIFVSIMPSFLIPGVKIIIPQRGDQFKLLTLSLRNAEAFRRDRIEKSIGNIKKDAIGITLTQLKQDLKMKNFPERIECFDNSNLSGNNAVSACVVFQSGVPLKNQARHYYVKDVKGANDVATMKEILRRRYSDAKYAIPDLIIVDGGKPQLNAAISVLKEIRIYDQVTVIGIAKRLEEIYTPDDPIPLYLNKTSASLKIIRRIRDEAHRFGLTFHRNVRSKQQVRSEWDDITGIGELSREKIFSLENDLSKLKGWSKEALEEKLGKRVARILWSYFGNL